jgi:hypothetical protein
MELKEAGIAPEKVHFISLGVQHGIKGVIEDYTIFPGDELLDLCRHYMDEESEGIPKCILPNIHGFLAAMTDPMFHATNSHK